MEKGKNKWGRKTTFLLETKRRNKEGYELKNAEILPFKRRAISFLKFLIRRKTTLTPVSDRHV